jgi:hypothetical protein
METLCGLATISVTKDFRKRQILDSNTGHVHNGSIAGRRRDDRGRSQDDKRRACLTAGAHDGQLG